MKKPEARSHKPELLTRFFLLASGFWLLASFSVLGQGGTQNPQAPRPRQEDYAIRGKIITGSSRDGDARIEVKLERTTMQVIQMAYTDAVGNFEFRSLGPGMYWVVVNLDGFEPVRQSVELYPNMSVGNANIFLNRLAPALRPKLTGVDAADPDVVDVSQMKENFPRKATQNFERALEEKKKGQTEKAIQLLEEAVQIAPAFYHAHNNLGVLYQSAKRYGDAEREFRRARDLNLKSAEPLTNLGSLLIEMADLRKAEDDEVRGKLLDDALDALEQAVKLNPRSPIAYYYLGAANYKSSFFEEAEAALVRALELDSHLNTIRLMLANVYLRQGKWREVVQTLDAYLQEDPKASDRAAVEETRAKIQRELDEAGDK
ncbi:MAG: tetratricopeptide repeat protein [Acidobacteria bacterium]|nr:tetratricopeptide repeat protein [Acidobacteriota bacterium]